MMKHKIQNYNGYLTNAEIQDAYYSWLYDLVSEDKRGPNYRTLIDILHKKDFYWSVPNDDNRAFEGKELRCRFCEENNIIYDYEQFREAASMLELIIALAYRCESIMFGQCGNLKMRDWFWVMLSNVGLDKYTDEECYDFAWTEIYGTLDIIVNRTYSRNGHGGLFPLKRAKKDQRKVELWYQMNSYLVENYYDDEEIV